MSAALFLTGAAHADITGSVNATITLTSGCIINGQAYDDGDSGVDFGALDFGSETTLFTQADAEVTGTGAGIAIQCTAGISPNLVFQAGQHDGQGSGGGGRAMQHAGAPSQYVTYNLYSDAGRSVLIPLGGGLALDSTGNLQTVHVFGRAYGASGLIPGVYSDVVIVLLEL